jgi:hypothetical protein
VTEFLRDALAADAVPVPELDEKARAKGLLSRRESITTAKVFKRAKKFLGITSRRRRFGARSRWLWKMLRQQNESSVDTRPEPAPARRIPVDWLEGVACLDDGKPPSDVPRHRWRQFVEDCREFAVVARKRVSQTIGDIGHAVRLMTEFARMCQEFVLGTRNGGDWAVFHRGRTLSAGFVVEMIQSYHRVKSEGEHCDRQ